MRFIAEITIFLLLYINSCVVLGFYFYVRKVKKLIGFQLGMNISMVMAGMVAFSFGLLLILQYPFHFTLVTIFTTLVGLIVGALFGFLFDYQTAITGLTNGLMIGLMAPMIGTVVEKPFMFVWFTQVLFAMCLFMIFISIQRS